MNKTILVTIVAIMTLGIVSESRADTSTPAFNSAGQVTGTQGCNSAIPNCYDCSYDSDRHRVVCNQCSSNYVLSEDSSKCIHPSVANDTCAGNQAYVKVNGKCVIMNECRKRNSSSICTACYKGYHLDENNVCVADENQVILKDPLGCLEKSNGSWDCSVCAEGYAFAGGRCYLKSELPDCSTVSDNTLCINNGEVGCPQGYYFIPQNSNSVVCYPCTSGALCHKDAQTDNTVYDSCQNGYYLR